MMLARRPTALLAVTLATLGCPTPPPSGTTPTGPTTAEPGSATGRTLPLAPAEDPAESPPESPNDPVSPADPSGTAPVTDPDRRDPGPAEISVAGSPGSSGPTAAWSPAEEEVQELLARADRFFEEAETEPAAELYGRVIAVAEPELAAYAHYRRIWCLFNLAAFDEALRESVQLLELLAEPTSDFQQNLRRSAVQDLPLIYAEVGQPRHSRAFFERLLFAPEVPPALRRLAELLDPKDPAAANLVRSLIPTGPPHPPTPDHP